MGTLLLARGVQRPLVFGVRRETSFRRSNAACRAEGKGTVERNDGGASRVILHAGGRLARNANRARRMADSGKIKGPH